MGSFGRASRPGIAIRPWNPQTHLVRLGYVTILVLAVGSSSSDVSLRSEAFFTDLLHIQLRKFSVFFKLVEPFPNKLPSGG